MQPTPPSSTPTSAGTSRQASSSARVKVTNVQRALRTESTIAIPNPTPSATPPSASLRRGTQAESSTASSARASSSRAQNPARQAIDVDELYERKYAIKEEDLVEAIDAGAFRQSVREKGRPRERERERYSERQATVPQAAVPGTGIVASTATATAAVRAPSTSASTGGPPRSLHGAGAGTAQPHYEHPSIIAEALDNMKAKQKQKRAAAAVQQATELTANKRRRTDDASQVMPPSSRAQAQQAAAIVNNQQDGRVLSTPHASTSFAQDISRAASLKRKHSPKSHYQEREGVIVISDSGDEAEALPMPKQAKSSSTARQVSPTRGARIQEQETRTRASTPYTVLPAKRQREVIELYSSSDGEVMEIDRSPPQKKTKPTPSSSRQPHVDIDDYSFFDEGPTGYYAPETPDPESSESEGWDLNDPDRWVPMPENNDTILTDALDKLNINEPPEPIPPPMRYIPPNTSMHNPFPRVAGYTQGPPIYIWDKLAMADNIVVPRKPRPFTYLPPSRLYIPPRDEDFGLHKLRRAFHDPSQYAVLKRAPGCVSKIEQKGALTVIASGSIGGLPDVLGETPHVDNGPGSLMIWDGKLHILPGHHAAKVNPTYVKHYAVHDVAFHPTRQGFVSCGADRQVIYWEEKDANDADNATASEFSTRWAGIKLFQGDGLPYELAFKPDSPVLAVGERKLHLWVVGGPDRKSNRERASFCVQKSNEPHHIGSIGWGSSSTDNQLFASSEPDNEGDFTGIHKAYDVSRRSLLYAFDATEAGDMLCIRPDGESLALSTRGEGNKSMLRLYDIKRKDNTATTTIVLDPYDALYPNFEGEVNCSTFSPDGILLALARNDSQTHVYDVRFMTNGRPPLFAFRHTGACLSASPTVRYGVVKAQWLQSARSRRLALVTGGDDGCVRSWDPQTAADDPKNGHIVAEALSDIGHFSIGDPFNGEHRLVVGDCNGDLYFFDNTI